MKNRKSVGLFCALALAATFAAETAAQGNSGGPAAASGNAKAAVADGVSRNPPDMRLWSFGDCDNKFPYVSSDEHKECVRVVGSEEARDARAYRICETSNGQNYDEVARCKSTYKANKDRAPQSGYAANSASQTEPSAEDLKRVRAIAAAAVERDKVSVTSESPAPAAQAGIPDQEVAQPLPEDSGSSTLLVVLAIGAALIGAGAFVARRRQGGMLSPR